MVPEKNLTSNNNEDEAILKSVTEDKNDDNRDGNLQSYNTDKNPSPKPMKHLGGELESAKAEMGEVMEENQRLKQYLGQIMKDYEALQKKFYEITNQDSKNPNHNNNNTSLPPNTEPTTREGEDDDELVSLSLGRCTSLDSKKLSIDVNVRDEGSLALGLDCKLEASNTVSIDDQPPLELSSSPDNSGDDEMKDGNKDKEREPPSAASKRNGGGDDEVGQGQQPSVKKARVSVRVRCDTPTMNDGCQWRKYGQKIAKGNPCPRAYYRCTVAPSCPVRKQVQRCAEDMSILITTYEGTHNHPLSISATTMASTTSAAAYMLMSGSSISSQGTNSATPTTMPHTQGADLHDRVNFNIPNTSQLNPIYLPNSSSSTFSAAPNHPTITLDLTSSSNTSSSTTQFMHRITPRYSSTNLTFNSSKSTFCCPNGILNYVNNPNNKTQFSLQDHTTNSFNFKNLMQKGNPSNPSNISSTLPPIPDSIAQAAKVLTSDPSFQSVLTAALSSFIGGSSGDGAGGGVVRDNNNNNNNNNNNINNNNNYYYYNSGFAEMMKWSGVQSSTNVSSTSNGCVFLPPPLPLSGSKGTSTSPGDGRDNAS